MSKEVNDWVSLHRNLLPDSVRLVLLGACGICCWMLCLIVCVVNIVWSPALDLSIGLFDSYTDLHAERGCC